MNCGSGSTLNGLEEGRDIFYDSVESLTQGLAQPTCNHQVELVMQQFREIRTDCGGQGSYALEYGFF